MLRYVVFFAVIAAITNGYPTGGPPSACQDLTPHHGTAVSQPGEAPYNIFINKSKIHPGEKVQVTVQGKGGEQFKGFMLQARQGDTVIGSFELPEDDPEIQTLDCTPGAKNTITHRSRENKNIVIVTWVAPTDFQGTVTFKGTIVKDFKTFWVGETSSELTVKQ